MDAIDQMWRSIDGEPATFDVPPVLGANKDKDRKPIPRIGQAEDQIMSMNGFIKLVLGIDDAVPLRPLPPRGTAWHEQIIAKRAATEEKHRLRRERREAMHQHQLDLYRRTRVLPREVVIYEREDQDDAQG